MSEKSIDVSKFEIEQGNSNQSPHAKNVRPIRLSLVLIGVGCCIFVLSSIVWMAKGLHSNSWLVCWNRRAYKTDCLAANTEAELSKGPPRFSPVYRQNFRAFNKRWHYLHKNNPYNIGLMVTKDDMAILPRWFSINKVFFDAIVVMDGSTTNATRHYLESHHPDVTYMHESQFSGELVPMNDQSVRSFPYRFISEKYGYKNWIMLLHPDEFYIHDPRKVIMALDKWPARGFFDKVLWNALHVIPHPTELPAYHRYPNSSAADLFHHYHSGYQNSGMPFSELRLFKNNPGVHWNSLNHGLHPDGLSKSTWLHRPSYLHYKISNLDAKTYSSSGHFSGKWSGVNLGKSIHSVEDLFVEHYCGGGRCYHEVDVFCGELRCDLDIGNTYL